MRSSSERPGSKSTRSAWSAVRGPQPVPGKDGGLLPVLRNGFGHYSEALRRDLLALHALRNGRPSRVPSLDDYLGKEAGV